MMTTRHENGMPSAMPVKSYCPHCGNEIALWFSSVELRPDEDDDADFERWLDTPCSRCGGTPRARPRAH